MDERHHHRAERRRNIVQRTQDRWRRAPFEVFERLQAAVFSWVGGTRRRPADEALFDDPLMACLPSGHPLARKRNLPLTGLQHDRLFWFAAAEPDFFHDYCERVFKTLGYTPERLPEPPDHAALLGLVACGQGVALVPQSLTNVKRKGVVFRPLVEADQRRIRIGLAVCSGPLSPPVQGLVDLIKAGQSANAAGTSHR